MARLFELENDKIERDNKVRGIFISVAFHAALFLLLWLIVGVSQFNPPIDDLNHGGGVMVNLGYMDDGKGTVQPTNTDNQIEIPKPVTAKSEPPVKAAQEKAITQENTDAPVISKKEIKKPKKETKLVKKTPVTTVVTKTPPVVAPPKPKATFHYNGGTQNNSPGEGDGKHAGDKGQTNGSPFGNVYSGNPGFGTNPLGQGDFGNGTYKLSGRKMLSKPCPSDNSQETGTIVLKITVDKYGKIIASDGPAQGSTTGSPYLLGVAKKSLSCCRFDASSQVTGEQFGTITFKFTVK